MSRPLPELLRRAEVIRVARERGVGIRTVRNLIEEGHLSRVVLPGGKLGYYRRDQLLALLKP